LRQRRRQWLKVAYRGDFDLAAEVSAIVDPLAAQLAALPRPLVLRAEVDDVADAVHEVLSTAVGMLAVRTPSERLTDALRVLDIAARDLARRIPKAAVRQALPGMQDVNAAKKARRDRERAERTLSKMHQTRMGAPR
jgi:hypothetical protein